MQNENYKIEIHHDAHADNPFKEWDGLPLIAVKFGNKLETGYQEDQILETIQEELTYEAFKENKKRLMDLTEEYVGIEFTGYDLTEEEDLNEVYSEVHYAITSIDDFDLIKEVLENLNIAHHLHYSRGYSQGDYAEVIFLTEDKEKIKTLSKLFNDWAWGDTYGYVAYKKKPFIKTYEDGSTEEDYEWEEEDSCWGFYGDNPETNGMKENIPEEYKELLKEFDYTQIKY